jgi:hypothetical protein
VIAYPPFTEARAYAFERRDDGALLVPYSLVPRPPVERVESTCNLWVGAQAAAFDRPVLVDMIDGTVRQLDAPRAENGELVFERLPITDYSLVLTDARWLPLQPRSSLLSHFEGPGDMMRQFVSDRFGRGRPEFWRLVDEATAGEDCELAAVLDQAKKTFHTRLEPADGHVEVQGLPLVARQLRDPSWRSSVVNEASQHADRYFVEIACGSVEQAELRVLLDGEPMKQRPWKDKPENIGTWMATAQAGAVRVFVAVPNGEAMPQGVTIEYRVCPAIPQVYHFRDRRTERPCVVFWIDPFEELATPGGTVRLVGSNASLPRDAIAINLVSGEPIEGVDTRVSGETLEVKGIPIGRDPLLVVERSDAERLSHP